MRTSAEELDAVETLLLLFEWPDTPEYRFHALVLYRHARSEPFPTWDDFRVGITR